jgi:hypothetical protein
MVSAKDLQKCPALVVLLSEVAMADDGNDNDKRSLVVANRRAIGAVSEFNLGDLRQSLDDPTIRRRLAKWLNGLPVSQRTEETETLLELGNALKRIANDSETRADFVGNLANPGGVIAAAAIGAVAIGTTILTPAVLACIATGGLAYVGGHTYKFIASRAAKRDRQRSEDCGDIAASANRESEE